MSVAQRLDAADGVMDGRFYGRPIIETSGVRTIPSGYRTRTAATLDAADGVMDGRYYGRPIVETTGVRGYRTSTAAAIDAADGVIDGRYYGRPIVETAGSRYYGAGYGGYRSSTAGALDAADGVIDGRYYGRPIVETDGYYGDLAGYRGGYGRHGYGGYYGGSRLLSRGYGSSAALAVDAADGVIDGRYYGRPIVETTGTYTRGYPVRRYGGVTGVSAYGYGGYEGLSGSVTRLGNGNRYVDGYYGRPALQRSSAAVALDAADGVMDGRYYGRPIVESSRVARRVL